MSETKTYTNADPRVHRGVPQLLEENGFSEEAIEGLLALDLAMFQWRRAADKGEVKGKLLEAVPEKLEPALLQGLMAIAQISSGLGRPAAEPTIGLVAEAMEVDPSRASRIVAGLVERGYVARHAAQDDARRSVLQLTPRASAFLGQFSAAKWRLLSQVFEGWEAEDIVAFNGLLRRYLDSMSAALAKA